MHITSDLYKLNSLGITSEMISKLISEGFFIFPNHQWCNQRLRDFIENSIKVLYDNDCSYIGDLQYELYDVSTNLAVDLKNFENKK